MHSICSKTDKLTKIYISEDNTIFYLFNNQIIIGESSIDAENYDELVFCSRDVKNAIVPKFLKQLILGHFTAAWIVKLLNLSMNLNFKQLVNMH